VQARVDLAEMPADPALDARSLAHEIIAMVDQQPQLTLPAGELCDRQIGLAPGGARDRERVDRSDLPASRPARRAPDIIFVGTRTSSSPARSRSLSSVRVRCRQSSTADLRRGQRVAHASALRWPSPVASTVASAKRRATASVATIVGVRLCASMPITTSPSSIASSLS
jgi:hypothetical protein